MKRREEKSKEERERYKHLNAEVQKIASRVKKRKEVKGKGENERYTHLNAEFQRIPRRDKKAFLSDQGKEIVEKQ